MLNRPAVLLAALTLPALPCAALAADVPGNNGTKTVLKTGPSGVEAVFERKGDTDWYLVTLKGGQNYAFHVTTLSSDGGVTLNLRDRSGKVLRTAFSNGGGDDGFEFRVAKTKSFFVEFKDVADEDTYPSEYGGDVIADARGDASTAATIAVGQAVQGRGNWGYDTDYFRTSLVGGKVYTVTIEDVEFWAQVVDSRGKALCQTSGGSGGNPSCEAGFSAPASGTYYVVANGSHDFGGGAYRLSLAAR